MGIIFITPDLRRHLLGKTRKSTRRKARKRLATYEWISRVRYYDARREPKRALLPLVVMLLAMAAVLGLVVDAALH